MFKKIILTLLLIISFGQQILANQPGGEYVITNSCIGKVCIGDTFKQIKDKYYSYKIKPNDSNTCYYIFDENNEFILEFSNKSSNKRSNLPIRYIMTSNSKFRYINSKIQINNKISELEKDYGQAHYESGPDGYIVSFDKWPISSISILNNYSINIVVSVFNSHLAELVEEDNSVNEMQELNLLKSDPTNTYISTFEIYSDYDKKGVLFK